MNTLAIIGTGIAGMACGHYLHRRYDLTVYESENYIGGHTNTITADEDGKPVYVDSGFMVFNYVTYPLLTKLFEELQVPVMKTSMSFSVQHIPSSLEYCGSGLNGLFAQRGNIVNPRFIRMLFQIARFNRHSPTILDDPSYADHTIADYCKEQKLGDDFIYRYLVPMSSAVWSTPMDLMLHFPATTLIRFFYNHGFLGLNTQHQWYTVQGGSRVYREKIIAPFRDRIKTSCAAVKVERINGKVQVTDAQGNTALYDKVILACHGDQAYRMVQQKTEDEDRLLRCFKYQQNKAILHTDERSMPKNKKVWSSWNYRIAGQNHNPMPATIYWMNELQRVSEKKNYFVSINGDENLVDPKKKIWEKEYEHPLFDIPAIRAQQELHKLNATGPVYYCGSYFRYGFHEDGLLSATDLCKTILSETNNS